MIFNIQAKIDI